MRPRSNSGEDLVRVGRGEDEAHVLGRLLDQLQQGIKPGRGNHVSFVDDVDLVARRCGREHRALTQIAGVVHAPVTRSIKLDDVDGARSTRSQIHAVLARAARLGGRSLLAVQRSRHDSSCRRFAAAAGAGEKVRVVNAIVVQSPCQRRGDVFLAHHVGQPRRPVGAVEGQRHAPTLTPTARPADRCSGTKQPRKGTPRAPDRARLPLLPSGPGGVERGDTARGVGHQGTGPRGTLATCG